MRGTHLDASSTALTALAAIALATSNPGLHIAHPDGTSIQTIEFPSYARAAFAIIAVLQMLHCASVYYAFVRLGLPWASRNGEMA